MSATGSLGSLLERYAGIRSAVNTIRTCLVDWLTGPLNQVLCARFNRKRMNEREHSVNHGVWQSTEEKMEKMNNKWYVWKVV